MNSLARVLWWCLGIFVGLWALIYAALASLGCSWVQPGTQCTGYLPWEQDGEDFRIFVAYPLAIAMILTAAAIFFSWRARR